MMKYSRIEFFFLLRNGKFRVNYHTHPLLHIVSQSEQLNEHKIFQVDTYLQQ